MRRGLKAALVVCVLLGLAPTLAVAAPEDFPKPPALEPRVEFWKRIYTEVGTGGGLLHDPDDLSLVYEVIAFPNARWDVAGERHMKARRAHVSRVLQALARGKRSGLSAEEQRILALFPASVSSRTLRAKANAVRFQLGQSDKFRAGLARQGRWDAFIRSTFSERGLPPEIGALPHVESSFNPNARSSVGASGIWQFMPSTGRLYMRVDSAVDERNDPYLATVAAARLLKSNYETIGAWPLAITAYNHGLGGMQRAVRQLGTRDIGVILERYKSRSFGFASKNFYASFMAAMEIDREPERYFGPIARDPAEDPERVILDHYYRGATLAAAFGVPLEALRKMNPAVSSSVWEGKRLLPQGYELRVPRDPLRAPPKVVLASIAGSERLAAQVPEYHGTHRVRAGETLSSIARRYGVSMHALQRENGLRSANRIRVGQRLRIPGRHAPAPEPVREQPATSTLVAASSVPEPAPAAGVYRVRSGDTLASIARRFGVSPTDLAAVNRIRDPNQIHPGQVIELPGGSLSAKPGDRSHAGVYSVRRGDNLDEIAARFGVTVRDLIALNGIQNKNRIAVGQTLYVPGPPEPSPAPAQTPDARPGTPAAGPAIASASPAEARPAPGASAPAAAPADTPGTYTVRPGDSLEKIAAQTGVPESELIARNGIRNKHRIAAGQTLVLRGTPAPAQPPSTHPPAPSADPSAAEPAGAATTYTVRRGDTLEKIAAQTGVSERELISRNGIRNKHRITAGQTLELREAPDAAPEASAPAESAEPPAAPTPDEPPAPAPTAS